MKKILTLAALLCAIFSYGQHKVAHKIETLIDFNTTFRTFSPLTINNSAANKADVVTNATYATMNIGMVNDIAANHYPALEISIPYNGKAVTVQLYRVDIMAEGFHIDTDKQKNIAFEKGAYYRGIVKGDASSVAAFNFFKGEMSGIISNTQLNNLVIGRLRNAGNVSDYIIYSDAQLNILNDYKCATGPSKKHGHDEPVAPPGTQSERCVTMYFELDYDLYLQNNSDTTIASNWITSVFNNVQTLFDNDGITTAIKSVYIWTEQDPYFGDDSSDYLFQFNALRPVFDGDLGQLLGIDVGGLGGVAVGIDGLCTNDNFSYSEVEIAYQDVPLFSWTVQVMTHELGHLMGSPHTHACTWNGDDTAIDGCGSSVGFVEGWCEQGPIPSETEQGTIMSYCHLVWGVGINFSNGFGIQPATRMINNINNSLCLSTDCINTCINTIAGYTVTNPTASSATVSWTDMTGGPWEIAYGPISSPLDDWTEVAVNSFTVNSLNPEVYYKFGVRPVCESSVPPQTEITFGGASNYCSGGSFIDTGGVFGEYMNDEILVRTFVPNIAGEKIEVTFLDFSIEEDYDFMHVYDGADSSAPLLGTYTGDDLPGPFVSTAEDGSITFVFTSDYAYTQPGWNAQVSCGVMGTGSNHFSEFSYYPNPSKGIVNIKSGNTMDLVQVYNVAGQLLLTQSVGTTETAVNIASFADGVYFFKAVSGTKEKNFRVVKQ